MARQHVLMACVVVLWCAIMGCGSSGTTPPARSPVAGHTFEIGALRVGTASAAGFKTVTLSSPPSLPVAFTVLYGSQIVRLQEMGHATIALSAGGSGHDDIYVMNVNSARSTRLTGHGASDCEPTWSPDGKRIAFSSERSGNYDIWSMTAEGTGLKRLTANLSDDTLPDWSPDGASIAFHSDRKGSGDIYVMNADGTGETRTTTHSSLERYPAWSPDGRQIAFLRAALGVTLMNADGTGVVGIADGDNPTWAPDGSRIAFEKHDGNDFEIWTMNPDGSDQTPLTNNEATDWDPAWSPDGERIAFASNRTGPFDIYVMNADGSDVRNLTKSGAHERGPSWCPVPSVARSLIGAPGSDGGEDPPFGSEKPLAVVGMTDRGLVSAATIGLGKPHWPSIRVTDLSNLGSRLAGVRVTATRINNVQQDQGPGLSPRLWDLQGTPNTGAALIFFAAQTGRITSVIASADRALGDEGATGDGVARAAGGRIILRGAFVAAYNADEPSRDLIRTAVEEIALDADAGTVVAVK